MVVPERYRMAGKGVARGLDGECGGVQEGLEGSAAMAVVLAFGGGEFGHGAAFFGQEEEGIVAEASGASGDCEDFAFDCAGGGGEDLAVAG